MAQATKIEWTDVSWNPVHGCSRVSTGCPEWVRDLRDACLATRTRKACNCRPGWDGNGVYHDLDCPAYLVERRTAFFMKQMGGARPGTALEDLPEDLRIREFPA